jgi:catechol 2,3-dioxygenase-like lactoylglutathione lyase family enzyme
MTTATIGNHAKFTARTSDRDRIRQFYRDVLGCTITKQSNEVDFFQLGDGFFVAAIYDDEPTLSAEDLQKSIWLELKADEPAKLTETIRAFGVTELETWEKDRLYFQAPGGQVFRVAGTNEDLSRFEA